MSREFDKFLREEWQRQQAEKLNEATENADKLRKDAKKYLERLMLQIENTKNAYGKAVETVLEKQTKPAAIHMIIRNAEQTRDRVNTEFARSEVNIVGISDRNRT